MKQYKELSEKEMTQILGGMTFGKCMASIGAGTAAGAGYGAIAGMGVGSAAGAFLGAHIGMVAGSLGCLKD